MLAYDWNFLGLSTENKPTAGEKVVDGSTYYECDTSLFYIYYNGEWYQQTFVTEDGINFWLYKALMKKMFGKLFDSNISKGKIIKPTTGTEIEFTTKQIAQITDLTGYGDTFQQTYSGKNLLPSNGLTVLEQDGMTFTPVYNENNELLYINANGTYIGSNTSIYYPIGRMSFISGETYTCSGCDSGSNSTYRIRVESSSSTGAFPSGKRLFSIDGPHTEIASANESNVRVSIQVFKDKPLDNVKFYPQIEFNSTATSYEPYVGGVPAPNPDYPQPVNVVTGRQVVGVRSKNLIDNNHLEYLATNANADTIILSSLPTGIRWKYTGGGSPWLLFKVMDLRGYEGKTIRMSAKFDDNGTEYRIMTTNEDGTGRNSAAISNTSGETISYTVPNELGERHFLGYRIGAKAQSVSNFTDLIMTIDEEDMDYSPYGADYEINLGKNLFTFGYGSGKFQGITWTRNGDTAVGVGTTTGNYTDTGTRIDLPAPLKAGQNYVFSIPTPASFRCSLYLFDKNDQVISPAVQLSAGETSAVFSKEVDIYKARITVSDYGGAGKELNIELRAQIELGSTATEYAPQFEPIELCKIGDYQDYIYKSGNDWYVHKDIAKYTFTGSENWGSSQYGTNSWVLNNVITFSFDTNKIQIISNIATGIAHVDRNTAGEYAMYSGSNTSITFRNTSFTSKSDIQAATTDNYIYYALATPTDTKITDTTLIANLNSLLNYIFPVGEHQIVITADDLPMALKLTITEKE